MHNGRTGNGLTDKGGGFPDTGRCSPPAVRRVVFRRASTKTFATPGTVASVTGTSTCDSSSRLVPCTRLLCARLFLSWVGSLRGQVTRINGDRPRGEVKQVHRRMHPGERHDPGLWNKSGSPMWHPAAGAIKARVQSRMRPLRKALPDSPLGRSQP